MSFVMRYNAGQDEIENLSTSTSDAPTSVEDTSKSKKLDKSSSILDKYFKSFKTEKNVEDDLKNGSETSKDNTERKNVDVTNECSGSPIKDYFKNLSKRSESIDTNSDVESIKENKDLSIGGDKWKLFSDIKYKLAQAVEDIKSRSNEETKDKLSNIDNLSVTDSEDNSLHQEPEQNSFTSTDNQVPSLTNSTHNLSELSPPIISHSSTMTDMDLEITNSDETNRNLTESTEGKQDNDASSSPSIKRIRYDNSDDDEHLEIESGVDALEDELLMPKESTSSSELNIIDDNNKINLEEQKTKPLIPISLPIKNDPPRKYFITLKLLTLSVLTIISFIIFPSMLILNGFFLGLWFSNFIHSCYLKAWDILENNSAPKKNLTFPNYQMIATPSNIFNIVEFEPLKKYQGWINMYMLGKYDPLTYHISMTQTAFMKLEGCTLRISFTHNKIPKRALWDEKPYKVPFFQHRIYDLEGAKIKLLPLGIVRKRHWSKKYPICIVLKDSSKLTIYNAKSRSVDENGCPLESSPLKSKDNSLDKISKSEHSLSESKEQDLKSKTSPKKISIVAEDKLSKSLPLECTGLNSEDGDKKLTKTKSSKSFSIKAIKEQLYPKNVEALPIEDSKLIKDSSDPPIIRDRPDSSNSMYCDSQMNETNLMDDFKEVSQYSDDENDVHIYYDKNVLNDEWSKEEIDENDSDLTVLYLFGRTGRDKDEWFRRLKSAIDDATKEQEVIVQNDSVSPDESDQMDITKNLEPFDNLHQEIKQAIKNSPEPKAKFGSLSSPKKTLNSSENQSVLWTSGENIDDSSLVASINPKRRENFWKYMKNIVEKKELTENTDKNTVYDALWLNAMVNRIIYDTFKNTQWINMVQERIQKKLKSLKLPPFMSPLLITALEFGPESPQIRGISPPTLNSKGIWIDLHISYDGRATMTLMTQLNLMYLKEKKDNQGEESIIPKESKVENKDMLAVYDSDLDDTAESSSEDETILTQSPPIKPIPESDPTAPSQSSAGSSAKKILRFVDKIAASKYFQHVSEYKYVKRALEEVSNTDLKLSVELYGLIGCLTINIPPPPSDRIWIGFRDNPQLLIKAKPEVGSRVINFAHVTSWIEKKLCSEFEKVLVLPNMEDFQLDFMIPPVID